ncbi:MAG: hypothetical protein AAGD38_24350, partial [Acidobacteriota bacterium]
MKTVRDLLLGPILGGLGALLVWWAFPRVFVLFPDAWTVTRDEAVAIAFEEVRAFGDEVAEPYLSAQIDGPGQLDRRLQLAAAEVGVETIRSSRLGEHARPQWHVTLYPPEAASRAWSYQVAISLDGRVIGAIKRYDEDVETGILVDEDHAVERARDYLERRGLASTELDSE